MNFKNFLNHVAFVSQPASLPDCQPAVILENLNCSLASIQGSSTPLVLCGDFNVPSIDWSLTSPIVSSANSKLLCSIVQDHFLSQLVNSPTRENHILDLVFTNRPDYITNVQLMDNLPGADHDSIAFIICAYPPNR